MTVFALLGVVIHLAGCDCSSRFRSDYDRTADFSQYTTYNFFDPLGIEEAQYQSLVSQYFRNGIAQEMEMRDFKRASEPDLLINVSARLDEKIRVTSSPSTDTYYGHGYRSSRYGFYTGHSTQTDVRQYTEGTVTIDFVDGKLNQLIWSGVSVGTITKNNFRIHTKTSTKALPGCFRKNIRFVQVTAEITLPTSKKAVGNRVC